MKGIYIFSLLFLIATISCVKKKTPPTMDQLANNERKKLMVKIKHKTVTNGEFNFDLDSYSQIIELDSSDCVIFCEKIEIINKPKYSGRKVEAVCDANKACKAGRHKVYFRTFTSQENKDAGKIHRIYDVHFTIVDKRKTDL